MKLLQFLDKVDQQTGTMTHEQLEAFVHESARILRESDREEFLDRLKRFSDVKKKEYDDGRNELSMAVSRIIPRLEKIKAGDLKLESHYNEDYYDDWYDSDDADFLFSDPEDLLDDIQTSIRLIHSCVDMEMYADGARLAAVLCDLEVVATGDYLDCTGAFLGFGDLFRHDLLCGDYKAFAGEVLFLAYMGNPIFERPSVLYELFRYFSGTEVSLETILQMGSRELPEADTFLPLWIDFLGRETEKVAAKLLEEAISMVTDKDLMLDIARRFADTHPEIYLQLLTSKPDDDCKMLRIGQEAMDRISPELKIRSEIALRSAYYADRLGKQDIKEQCWLEAFRSDTSLINYLRLKFLTDNPVKFDEKTSSIIDSVRRETLDKGNQFYSWEKNRIFNRISTDTYCVMLFFERRFDAMEAVGMTVREALGWSFTFMNEGLELLLLLLFDGHNYPIAMKTILRSVMHACKFTGEAYYHGSVRSDRKTDEEVFGEIINQWKSSFSLSAGEASIWMTKVEGLIRRRTEGIMDANKRNHYGECAMYIAAFGEVIESRGEKGGKEYFMEGYKLEYPKRRAFIAELRSYGMWG